MIHDSRRKTVKPKHPSLCNRSNKAAKLVTLKQFITAKWSFVKFCSISKLHEQTYVPIYRFTCNHLTYIGNSIDFEYINSNWHLNRLFIPLAIRLTGRLLYLLWKFSAVQSIFLVQPTAWSNVYRSVTIYEYGFTIL